MAFDLTNSCIEVCLSPILLPNHHFSKYNLLKFTSYIPYPFLYNVILLYENPIKIKNSYLTHALATLYCFFFFFSRNLPTILLISVGHSYLTIQFTFSDRLYLFLWRFFET